jgi:hypothetical protein
MLIRINNNILDNFDMLNIDKLVDKRWYNLKSGREPYRLHAYFSTFFNNCKILDIGTCFGTSAVSFCHNKTNHVISYDIVNKIPSDHDIHDISNLEFKVQNVMNDLDSEFIKNVKIILIDIDHYRKSEEIMLQKLRDINYSGIILLDDIHHPDKKMKLAMEELWNNIEEEKYDISKYGHHSGTGIVIFNDNIELVFD